METTGILITKKRKKPLAPPATLCSKTLVESLLHFYIGSYVKMQKSLYERLTLRLVSEGEKEKKLVKSIKAAFSRESVGQ